VVLAVPVAPPEARSRVGGVADEFIVLETPSPFYAIGQFYVDFSQTPDHEVVECLDRAAHRHVAGTGLDEEVAIPTGRWRLAGRIRVPDSASGLVVFAHGSGSSRHSPRNAFVAETLVDAGLGTLLFDLLTPEEERDRRNVFDVALLGSRLEAVASWLAEHPATASLPIGYFGASTGAAAALWAAATTDAAAVVSRGGRPDLAGDRLSQVRCPTLLIVGGVDHDVLGLNREAFAKLQCPRKLEVVPGASHLFEEPGALERVADLAVGWFVQHLANVDRTTLGR
jgi:dienelactone hydrolase